MADDLTNKAPTDFDANQLEAAADQAIAACGGDAREAVKALISVTALSGENAGLVMTLKKDGSALPPLAMSSVMDSTIP